MAIGVIENARLFLGGYDLSGAMNAATFSESAPPLEATTLADVAVARRAGLAGVTLAASGFCDPDLEPGLAAGLALTDIPMSVVPVDTEGEVAYFFRALLARLEPLGGAMDDMAEMSIDAESSQAAVTRGILGAHRTVSANGTGTAFQVDPGGSGRLLTAALHVTAASASDTLDVVIESAADEAFTVATTRLTFAQASAIGSEWVTGTAAVYADTWWRVKWTVAGVSPSFTFAAVMFADTADVVVAFAAFTGADGTHMHAYVPDSGFTGFTDRSGGDNHKILGNKLAAYGTGWGNQENVLASPALTSDHFELYADIVPVNTYVGGGGTTSRAGLQFRCNSTLDTGSEQIVVYHVPTTETNVALWVARTTSHLTVGEAYLIASGLNLGSIFTAGYQLGVNVDGDVVSVWTAPYGNTSAANRTVRGSATLVTGWNDASHRQFGLERAGSGDAGYAGGAGTTWDNVTLTYLA